MTIIYHEVEIDTADLDLGLSDLTIENLEEHPEAADAVIRKIFDRVKYRGESLESVIDEMARDAGLFWGN